MHENFIVICKNVIILRRGDLCSDSQNVAAKMKCALEHKVIVTGHYKLNEPLRAIQ
jgi:hypothetical protein